MTQNKSRFGTAQLTLMAMLAAMAYVAMLVTRPLPAIAGFLSYDLKDVVVVVSGFMLGPLEAALITVVVSLVEMVTVSSTGFIGLLMNVVSTCAFTLPPALYYRRNRTLKGAMIGLGVGVVSMTAVMLAWNYIITPLYMHVPRDQVAGMLVPVFLPFNLIKGGLNAGIAMLLYKPLSAVLRRLHLLPERSDSGSRRHFSVTATLISAFVVITCVVLFILMVK